MAVEIAGERRQSWLSSAAIGFLAGIDNIAASLAIASLLFAGPLSEGLGVGVGIVLVGGTILALVVALRSTLPNSIALVQESSVAILAAAIITATTTLTGPNDVRIATAVAVLGVSSLATGALFWITGRLKLGGLARFAPYPVVAGFLAGSGWLLIDGAVVMTTGAGIDLSMIQRASQSNVFFLLLPAIAFAIALEIAIARFRHMISITVVMALAVAVFFAVLSVSGMTVEEARALGYFPQSTASGGIELPTLDMLTRVDWGAVMHAAPTIIAVAAVSMVGLLLNISGLELAMRRDIDVNAELRSTGVANLLSGAIGGPSGYVGLAMTILAERTGALGRGAGIATAIAMLLGLVAAGSFVFEVPVFLTAGFVMFMGIGLLKEWVFATRRELPLGEWLIVLLILACIALVGFLEGLAVGLLVSIAVFVFNYARLPIMRLSGNGREYRSSVDRSAAAARFLTHHGEAIEMIQLQGYLFFGSADGMVKHVQRRLADSRRMPLRFLVLDFRHVSGLDSAATAGFIKIRRMSEDNSVKVFLTQVPDDVRRTLELVGIRFENGGTMRLEADIDHALEHAEEALLREQADGAQTGLLGHFNALAGPHHRMGDLLSMMSRVVVEVGDSIITAGDKADDLFFIAHGRVRVQITLANGRKLRLRTMTDGSFVGEIGLYMRQERTADVIVEMPSEIFKLGAEDLVRLEVNDPELALLVHRLLATNLCEKLAVANQTIKRSEH